MDHLDEPPDLTSELAEWLTLPLEAVVDALGSPWYELTSAGDSIRCGRDLVAGAWLYAGDPPQVMIGLIVGQAILVAVPRGEWQDLGRLTYRPSASIEEVQHDHPNVLEALAAAVQRAVRKRRRSFFWCRVCRRLTPPEDRHEDRVCMGCASQHWGIVY